MEVITDLHLHSKYSRAVSQQMVIPEIAKWAKIKGIDLVGIPDWTHPLWLREVKNLLEEAGEGVYKIKSPSFAEFNSASAGKQNFNINSESVRFILATEISSIYSQGGKTRRIHNLVLAPSFEVVDKINAALSGRGANLLSDGRPIVGLSSIELVELIFSVSSDCIVIPCHVWTPWFSLYGSKSGFDSINECFSRFAEQIFAIETGLSSNPQMNWRINELDNRSIVSFSDAHSPQKLGREATVFELDKLSFTNIFRALKSGAQNLADSSRLNRIVYTIEFYPEEGKYHYTGHRNCHIKQTPEQTKKLGTTCPTCGRPLTVGVMHRVEELAKRKSEEVKDEKWEMGSEVKGVKWNSRPPYVMLVPLAEILAESFGSGLSSQNVVNEYNKLTSHFGSEFKVLLEAQAEEISKISGQKVAEGISKVRRGDIYIDPGYDGEFGTVKIWANDSAQTNPEKQMSLF